jgi:hypothetical protein
VDHGNLSAIGKRWGGGRSAFATFTAFTAGGKVTEGLARGATVVFTTFTTFATMALAFTTFATVILTTFSTVTFAAFTAFTTVVLAAFATVISRLHHVIVAGFTAFTTVTSPGTGAGQQGRYTHAHPEFQFLFFHSKYS